MPEDWMVDGEIDWAALESAFLSGKWCVDMRDEDPFIRPRHTGSAPGAYDIDWDATGECVFLTNSGCTLTENERPSGCKALIAELREVGDELWTDCDYADGRSYQQKSATAWAALRDQLYEVANKANRLLEERRSDERTHDQRSRAFGARGVLR